MEDEGPVRAGTSTNEAEWFAATLSALLDLLARHLPGAWTERRGDAFGVVTGISIPTLNGVLATTSRPRTEHVASLLDTVRRTGLPYCLQVAPSAPDDLAAVAAAGGLVPAGDIPAMVLEDPSKLQGVLDGGRLAVRELSFADLEPHLAILSEGFGAPAPVLAPLVEALRFGGVHHYVGHAQGEAVATGTAIWLQHAVGIFDVATRPAHRRRGYASAITARAVLDGFAAGASRALLQATPAAERVYLKLGFRTVARWNLWVGTA